MKHFPWISLSIGIPLALALYKLSPLIPKTEARWSLSSSMVLSELGALAALIGLFFGLRKLLRDGFELWDLASLGGNLLLLLLFAYIGLELWAKSLLSG